MHRHLTILAAMLAGTAAYAVDPVGKDSFNTDPGFDLSSVKSENFYDVIVPIASEEGGLTLFDFSNSFGPLFQEHILPEFEKKYSLKVEYIRGDGETAVQQLVAASNSGSKAPADVYFIASGGPLAAALDAEVMANLPLQALLPNAAGFEESLAVSAGGFDHGGTYLPFHRNQTSMAYNSAMVPDADLPDTLQGLLDWAKGHPGKLAVTNPTGGGSGEGFMQSVAAGLVEGDACREMLSDYAATQQDVSEYLKGDCLAPVWDYYRELLAVSEITNGNSDTLNLLANGAVSIGTAWEDMTYDFIGRGLLPPSTRQELLQSGQVGGGDGMFLAANSKNPAAGLLFLDFVASHDVQINKLSVNGSRSARTDIDPTKEFTPEQANRLIPTDQFAERTFPQMPQQLRQAMKDYFVANVLRN